ncbi:preprotein translocase subunit SecG [Chitinophaga jiangningensis]|uniref:Protein-export membrane protein SecG n=1 Tax=Chitinophaga jiangningensis TaxID=1419482 RepID=A0A1M7CA71_9BACT|nr:preprotein translocase subunit SecG [Chitinophaga jiangningensis]SHL64145.1 preprotein translocase subunit SecG [Chitinophaga jiangningensis]
MLIVFGILIILACVLLGFFVLIQNPKGGGLSGSFGGIGNQVIGVRQTTDVLEKGTWILAALIAVLCLTAPFFIGGKGGSTNQLEQTAIEKQMGKMPVQQAPANTAPAPQGQPAPAPAPQGN